jgi:ketosteroid isomerase-like protein
MYTEDAEWLVPNAPSIKGRPAIAEAWKQLIGFGGNNVRVDIGEVQECGDWAYEVGRFAASVPDGPVLNAGKYIVIWKRQPTGEWKTHRDVFNWDIPPAA